MEGLKKYEAELTELKQNIWSFAETNYQEFKSVAVQKKLLKKYGFNITDCLADLPTSFMAEYGSGSPVIALLGEYDALPGLSQKATPEKDPLVEGGNGHGCGHCLSGTGAVGAALVVKDAIDAGKVKGTVRYYGCPAEEGGFGKGFMVKAGVFEDVDAALFWHPEPVNRVCSCTMLALVPVNFTFHGKSAHASANPHMGRSALDAVELMNVGANYLREHIPYDGQFHYAITNGGMAPNIVPDTASVSYRIRGYHRDTIDSLVERIEKCARGAARMTGTTYTMERLPAADSLLENYVLTDLVYRKMQEAGPAEFDEADEVFAKACIAQYPEAYEAEIKYISEKSGVDVTGQVLSKEYIIPEYTEAFSFHMGATDLGDVSHVVPTAQFNAASSPIGSPLHTWHNVAAIGSTLGTKGMLKGAEIMALSAMELMNDDALLQAAKAEFVKRTKGQPHRPLMPDEVKPPLFQQEEVYPEGLGL